MRALYQATAVALVILFVLGAPTPTPDAAGARLDVLKMLTASSALPTQTLHDMTFALE
jgi:hypothetical protein